MQTKLKLLPFGRENRQSLRCPGRYNHLKRDRKLSVVVEIVVLGNNSLSLFVKSRYFVIFEKAPKHARRTPSHGGVKSERMGAEALREVHIEAHVE